MTFKCPHCSRDFSHRTALRNHIKIHGSAIDNYLQEIENERNNIIIQNENEDDEEQQDDETYHLEDVEENLNQLDQQEKMVYNIEETNILDRETNMDIERESVEINVGKEKVNVEDVDIEDDDDDDGDDAEREMEDEEITQKGVGFELISVEYPPVAKIIDVTMSSKTNSEKRSRSFLLAKKALFQHAFDVIMHPLLSYKDRDFDLQTNNGDMWCFPHISTLLGDLPENATQTLTYSVNSNHPCHKCLISGEDLNNLRLSNNQIELRMPKMMKDILDQQLAYQYSIYNMNNIFWKYP
ncbi:unnamed protein product [Rhizophagus irregularis]|nr:unnamed protein product [Rhizophagus irregularis]